MEHDDETPEQPTAEPVEAITDPAVAPVNDRSPTTAREAQLDLLIRQLDGHLASVGRHVGVGPGRCDERPGKLVFEIGRLLVRDEYIGPVRDILAALGRMPSIDQGTPPFAESVVSGIRLVRLGVNTAEGTLETLQLILDGLPDDPDVVRERYANVQPFDGLGPGAASLNHVVHIAGEGGICPAVEPDPVSAGSAPDPGYTSNRCGGEGVKVVILDTGLDTTAERRSPWLKGVTGDADDKIDRNTGTLSEYAGHGTFIAGLVRSVAPRAEVYVRAVFNFGGGVLEADLVRSLNRALDCDHPDIISMSAGSYTFDATGLLSFLVFNERRLRHYKGVALVVAAGNDADREPFWPAAAPYTVSVGALASTRRGRAGFSNFGGWVDVYAPGQDLVNAFPEGSYTYREPPRQGSQTTFHGMARWSGTSFGTPIVAGLIAARMSETGENGRDAAAALLARARTQAQPGVGAVLLPE